MYKVTSLDVKEKHLIIKACYVSRVMRMILGRKKYFLQKLDQEENKRD